MGDRLASACGPRRLRPPGAAVISSVPRGAAPLLPAPPRPLLKSSPKPRRGEGLVAAALQAPAAARPAPLLSARPSPRLQGCSYPRGDREAPRLSRWPAGWQEELPRRGVRGGRSPQRSPVVPGPASRRSPAPPPACGRPREQGCCRRKGRVPQVRRQGEPSPCPGPAGRAQRRRCCPGLSCLSRPPAEARHTARFGEGRAETAEMWYLPVTVPSR